MGTGEGELTNESSAAPWYIEVSSLVECTTAKSAVSVNSFIHSIRLDWIRFQWNFEGTRIYAVLVLPSSEFQSFLTSPRFLCSTIIGHFSSSSSTTTTTTTQPPSPTTPHHTTLHYTTHTPHPLSPSFSSKPWLLDA